MAMTVDRADRAGAQRSGTHPGVTQRAKVFIYANDPISQAGVASQLRPRPEVQLVDAEELDEADVAVVVTESVDEEVLRVLRAVRRGSVPRTVLIAAALDDTAVVTAAEAGVSALVRRSEVTSERLVSVILKARDGGAEMPADLLAGLLGQVGRLQRQVLAPRGLRFSGLERPRGRGAPAGGRRPRHRRDRAAAGVQRADDQERAARRHDAAAVAQPGACGRLRRP